MLLRLICAVVVVVPGVSRGSTADAGSRDGGELIVFVRDASTAVSWAFTTTYLPRLRDLAAELGISVRTVDVADGAPAEVTITPLIIFQNHRGRSIYQGRYATLERVRNFVRTAQRVPQGKVPLVRHRVPVWHTGRVHIAAPLKVAHVTGTVPADYDHEAFVEDARNAIAKGFERFKVVETARLGRGDRLFYMDFNPWLSEDGTLFLSVALYSQFHCKEPIFEKTSPPLKGPWSRRGALFTKAAKALERAVVEQMAEPTAGDGFDPVPRTVPKVTWASLSLSLPRRPTETRTAETDLPLPRKWIVAPDGEAKGPRVLFRFPAPLDSYTGEAKSLRGEVELPTNLALSGLKGRFEVAMASITMGDPDLDHTLQSSAFFDSKRFPASTFIIESASSDSERIAFGELVTGRLKGAFSLKGVVVPLTVRASFEPVVGEDGKPRLMLSAGFSLDLKDFSIDGPDGPSTANHTVLLDIHVALQPAPGSS